jgi:hypothetical protein
LDNKPEFFEEKKEISGLTYYYIKFKELTMYQPYKYACSDKEQYLYHFPQDRKKTKVLFAADWSLNPLTAQDPNVFGQLTLNHILKRILSGLYVSYFAVGGDMAYNFGGLYANNKQENDGGSEGNRFLNAIKPISARVPFMVDILV